jgi:protein-L-isoaspartate(D-aspartate) O-methyltransferase
MDNSKYIAQRELMVQEQLIKRGITDPRVLEAMRGVPRHEFLPRRIRQVAYLDGALPIGRKQTISQPYVVALMSQMLQLTGNERVLEVGTGSGYQTAVLCELADEVVTLERHPLLAGRAGDTLERLGYENVEVHIGDGSQGLPDMAPYDAIIVTAAAPALPEPLRLQMDPEGGRMVLPIGSDALQRLEIIRRDGDQWNMERTVKVRFVPLIGRHGFRTETSSGAGV